jgi:hypothetical protein
MYSFLKKLIVKIFDSRHRTQRFLVYTTLVTKIFQRGIYLTKYKATNFHIFTVLMPVMKFPFQQFVCVNKAQKIEKDYMLCIHIVICIRIFSCILQYEPNCGSQ